jgi:sulfite reductase (NADPH) flavoprotein alpha-component
MARAVLELLPDRGQQVGVRLGVDLALQDLRGAGDGERRLGAASAHLAGLTGEEATVRVFVEANERFRLPRDTARDVVMIGPGTGVAPFRGFVQERAATGASGRNWLLFGNPHARHDFLYQLEWQQALKAGQLQRLDLAFSRDQADKVYVQSRLREQGRELYAWLENGAHLYVCGDASRMARDVEAAKAAGMPSVAALWGYREAHEDPQAWGATVDCPDAEALRRWLAGQGA